MFALTVSFRRLQHSEALASLVRTQAKVLDRLFPGILDCRVVIERMHRHHRTSAPIHVRIDVRVPGRSIVTEHQPTLHADLQRAEVDRLSKSTELGMPFSDPRLAVRQAFRATIRQLQHDLARCLDAQRSARGAS